MSKPTPPQEKIPQETGPGERTSLMKSVTAKLHAAGEVVTETLYAAEDKAMTMLDPDSDKVGEVYEEGKDIPMQTPPNEVARAQASGSYSVADRESAPKSKHPDQALEQGKADPQIASGDASKDKGQFTACQPKEEVELGARPGLLSKTVGHLSSMWKKVPEGQDINVGTGRPMDAPQAEAAGSGERVQMTPAELQRRANIADLGTGITEGPAREEGSVLTMAGHKLSKDSSLMSDEGYAGSKDESGYESDDDVAGKIAPGTMSSHTQPIGQAVDIPSPHEPATSGPAAGPPQSPTLPDSLMALAQSSWLSMVGGSPFAKERRAQQLAEEQAAGGQALNPSVQQGEQQEQQQQQEGGAPPLCYSPKEASPGILQRAADTVSQAYSAVVGAPQGDQEVEPEAQAQEQEDETSVMDVMPERVQDYSEAAANVGAEITASAQAAAEELSSRAAAGWEATKSTLASGTETATQLGKEYSRQTYDGAIDASVAAKDYVVQGTAATVRYAVDTATTGARTAWDKTTNWGKQADQEQAARNEENEE